MRKQEIMVTGQRTTIQSPDRSPSASSTLSSGARGPVLSLWTKALRGLILLAAGAGALVPVASASAASASGFVAVSKAVGANPVRQGIWERRSASWREQQLALAAEAGLSEDELASASVGALVDASFVHAGVGTFAVRIPLSALEDNSWRSRVVGCLAALAETQVRWSEWYSDPDDAVAAARRERLSDLAQALRKLKPADLRRLDVSPGQDLLRAMGLDEELLGEVDVRPASAPLVPGEPDPLGSEAAVGSDEALPIRLVILPERGDFLEYVAAVGDSVDFLRDVFWTSGTEDWLAIDHNSTRALALSFTDKGDPTGPGIPMDERNPKALEEHVAQVATRGLIERELGENIEPMLAAGLATELIIDLYGEADTYTDGDISARETNARSVFIPGGNSNGGVLPQLKADSRWREDRGRDYFVKPLRMSQKTGAKEAGRKAGKLVNFLLQNRNGSKEHLLRAPFLGPGGSASAPPMAFEDDYNGFLRAYRTAFLHWLRTEAGGRRGASAQRFQQLLTALAQAPKDSDPAGLIEGVYGLPLSAEKLDKDGSLEGGFLYWLSKRR